MLVDVYVLCLVFYPHINSSSRPLSAESTGKMIKHKDQILR